MLEKNQYRICCIDDGVRQREKYLDDKQNCSFYIKRSVTTEGEIWQKHMWYPLLWLSCCWSFTALRERKSDRDKKRTERGIESVCSRRTGPMPVPPTLTTAACRVRSAAFPEGNAEDKEEEAHFSLRSPHSVERGCRHREPAANRNWEGQTETERQMDR